MPRDGQQDGCFACGFPGCGRSYQRKEHLTRHQMNHFRAQSLSCPYCNSTFARTDTLRRHAKRRHKTQELPASRAPKACNNCRARKARCDGRSPCSACAERRAQCDFESSSSTSATEGIPSLSSGDETQQHISAYFANFHPIWPFLHQGMFAPDREPALLLQSVVMVGLWTKQDEASRHAAACIHEKLVASISQQRGSWDVSAPANQPKSNPEPWPVGTYQGILLNIIFAMLSSAESSINSRRSTSKLDLKPGQKVALSEDNHQLLAALVKSALQRGMFSYTDMFAHYSGRNRNIIFVWIGVEEVKRFALTLFKVWSICERDAATRNEELLSARDLKFSMPEREDLWDAPSHEELVLRLEADVREGKCAQNDVDNWISNKLAGKRSSKAIAALYVV